MTRATFWLGPAICVGMGLGFVGGSGCSSGAPGPKADTKEQKIELINKAPVSEAEKQKLREQVQQGSLGSK
jgi:hypothetical protein